MFYAQGFEAQAQCRGVAPGHHRRHDARLLQQFDALAIERVKAFERLAMLGKIQAAIGEYAIHVEEHHAHILRAQQQLRRVL